MKAATVLAIIAAVVVVLSQWWPVGAEGPRIQTAPALDARETELDRVYEALLSEWDRPTRGDAFRGHTGHTGHTAVHRRLP